MFFLLDKIAKDKLVEQLLPKLTARVVSCFIKENNKHLDVMMKEFWRYTELQTMPVEDIYKELRYKKFKELSPAERKILEQRFDAKVIVCGLGIYRGHKKNVVFENEFVGEFFERYILSFEQILKSNPVLKKFQEEDFLKWKTEKNIEPEEGIIKNPESEVLKDVSRAIEERKFKNFINKIEEGGSNETEEK